MQRFFHSRSFIELQNLISQPGARKSARMAGTPAGFTIVELLIVIVIIGILAAIVIVAYSGITQRASASAIADGLKGFEKAMRLYATENAYSAWPDETTIIGGGTTPTLPALIANAPGFKNYIQAAPNVSGILATAWRYDNDSDTYSGCSTGAQGANIFIANLTDGDMAQRVDDIMDDGNLSCGKVRWNASTNLMYSLSNNSAL